MQIDPRTSLDAVVRYDVLRMRQEKCAQYMMRESKFPQTLFISTNRKGRITIENPLCTIKTFRAQFIVSETPEKLADQNID